MLEFLVLLKLLSSKTHELTCTADPEEESAEYTAINALDEELELSIIAALYSSLLSLQNKIIKPYKRFYNK